MLKKQKKARRPFLDNNQTIAVMRGSVALAGMQDLTYVRQLVRINTRSRTVLQ